MRRTKLIIPLVGMLTMVGCYDFSNFDNIKVEPFSPRVVFPLVNSSVTFDEVLEQADSSSLIYTKPGDNKYYVSFRDTIALYDALSNYSIPDFTFSDAFSVDASEVPPLPVPSGQTLTLPSKSLTQTYAPIADGEIKSVKLSAGTLSIRIVNNFQNSISGTLVINSLLDETGNPLTFIIPETFPSQEYNDNAQLANGTVYLQVGSSYNTFQITADLTVHSLGNPISTNDNAAIEVSINGLDFEYIQGKINSILPLDDINLDLGTFENSYDADFYISEPKLTMIFENSFGIPIAFNIINFDGTNTNTNEQVSMVNEGTPPSNSLLLTGSNAIDFVTNILSADPVHDSLYLDQDNSNLEDFLNIAPNRILIKPTVTLGDATDNHDFFIRKSSELNLINEIEIPLAGRINNLVVSDTIDVEIPDIENDLNIASDNNLHVKLKFKFENGIPLDIYFQGVFLDDNNTELANLYDNTNEQLIIKSSTINPATGRTQSPSIQYSSIEFDNVKYEKIKNATKMIMRYRIESGGGIGQNVVIESTNSITAHLSFDFEGTVKP
ncbi:hypothetical protein [Tenuifilum thalassicum]|uniref:Uncharacterized protein n=1 Tax=Tenuifilum thalassicum TaxID=2590900 RepID=A0A7D4BCW0_9BACT|nr:hypothetical protein [Tenuifilum thalassicum]QKG79103.1 hypothetical protein FHG85_02085 [Tenuifilum thalassicum]